MSIFKFSKTKTALIQKVNTQIDPLKETGLAGYSIEKYHAGYCVKNPKGEYLWYGSDDGEEDSFFFSGSQRRTRADEYSDTKTCYSLTLQGAMNDLKKWIKQELNDANDLPPMEVYRFK